MLMKLLELYLRRELDSLIKKDVVFKTIGDVWRLPEHIQEIVREAEQKTASNKGMILTTALSYSGRNEILRAVKKILYAGIKPEELTEELFNSYLDTAGVPPPDLVIRTSGEMRISNFLLWQSAYSEFYFTETLWPDFTKDELLMAVQNYQRRDRRFGSISVRADAP